MKKKIERKKQSERRRETVPTSKPESTADKRLRLLPSVALSRY